MPDKIETIPEIIQLIRKRCGTLLKRNTTGPQWTNAEVEAILSNIASRLEIAWSAAEIDIRQQDAMMLLKTYAASPDEQLTPKALKLKRTLLNLVKENK